MKNLLFVIAFILFNNCVYSQLKQDQIFKKLHWLTGNWKRTNNKPGQTGTESWSVTSPFKLTGKGVTMQGSDTSFVDKLSLVKKGNDVFYVADVTGNPKPVYFKLTEITTDGFVCENADNDFPKKIAYNLINGHIKATISGNGKSVDYNFVKIL